MAMEYFCCYHSYLKKCRQLTDQEVGRLFRALLLYSSTGEAQRLSGNEAIAYDFIVDDIDRARANYAAMCQRNAENGRLGGRPKKPGGFSETQKSQNKNEYKNKNKDENEKKESPATLFMKLWGEDRPVLDIPKDL